jgi:hypothetical protein
MNSKLSRNRKELRRQHSCHGMRNYPVIRLLGLRKATTNLREDSRCPDLDSNLVPKKYNSKTLPPYACICICNVCMSVYSMYAFLRGFMGQNLYLDWLCLCSADATSNSQLIYVNSYRQRATLYCY